MKLQLTKDKTIDVKMPWEKPKGGGSSTRGGTVVADLTGVLLESGDPRGCPAVRFQWRKGTFHVAAAGFVPPPAGTLPTSWEESKFRPDWSLPPAFQAPQAALAVLSPDLFIRQTTIEALTGDAASASSP